MAEILAVSPDQIGVKAKTGEGYGPVGREEVIQAQCVVLLSRAGGG
jgi:2C-methyl-D-erythritol 2,4-cyclodiphosphate synthase